LLPWRAAGSETKTFWRQWIGFLLVSLACACIREVINKVFNYNSTNGIENNGLVT
jgi:hypothetical protein